jgi:hypothetical protein
MKAQAFGRRAHVNEGFAVARQPSRKPGLKGGEADAPVSPVTSSAHAVKRALVSARMAGSECADCGRMPAAPVIALVKVSTAAVA